MFDQEFNARINKIEPKVRTDKDDQVKRYCILEITTEFDDEIAEGIG